MTPAPAFRRRRLLRGLAAVLLGLLPLAEARAQAPTLNVFNWTDYIDPAVVERFTRETGIQVRYDVFDSLETLEAKLLAGRSGYDIVVPTNEPSFSRLIAAGALQPIDRARVPNWANLDPALMKQLETSDPGNRHGAIYLWGTIGLAYNVGRVRELAPDAPRDSWRLLFDPAVARRLAPCGIVMMDSQIDVIPSVLRFLGLNVNSTAEADLRRVEQTLMGIRPHIRTFASGGAIELLASGQACLAFTYSGDAIQAADRAREAGRGVEIRYVAPKEGAQLWFDVLAIPRDAPNPAAAHRFIDFLLQPDVMAAITNAVHYPNAVPASKPLVEEAIKNDRNVYPSEEDFARFFTVTAVPQAAERARSRLWARFKAGR
ncbi:polyamine ABC transporter substrate-binding protein [Elioraea thermophila]|uniref:polyamine ABC transporter substrate-binding protein n=1 Tax=Elioraea thermophila TaxID=2185104 RepID=UPI000DF320ED|nr:polyamine ABC transporter substrate-binding protein [Elioraea thermophila]